MQLQNVQMDFLLRRLMLSDLIHSFKPCIMTIINKWD